MMRIVPVSAAGPEMVAGSGLLPGRQLCWAPQERTALAAVRSCQSPAGAQQGWTPGRWDSAQASCWGYCCPLAVCLPGPLQCISQELSATAHMCVG